MLHLPMWGKIPHVEIEEVLEGLANACLKSATESVCPLRQDKQAAPGGFDSNMSSRAPSGDSLSHPPIGDGEHTELDEAYSLRPYGVGIDTHKKFIQVCVLVRTEHGVKRMDRTFNTTWASLCEAAEFAKWCIYEHGSTEAVDELEATGLHYCIESTGTYHLPVLRAWKGDPSVVNPLLANPSRRKTDVLDSRLLAYHSITGMWPSSYTPPPPLQTLRILLNMREDAGRAALRSSNRINNFLLRYGHTIGAEDSVTSPRGRALVEDLLADRALPGGGVCPDGLPPESKAIFQALYETHDANVKARAHWERTALQWAKGACTCVLGTGEIVSGERVFDLLATIPGFAQMSSLYWLAEVCTPTRFPSANALAAFAGCDPSLKVSAGKVTSQARRRGNQKLHLALTRAAQIQITRPKCRLGEWGYRLWKRHKVGGFKKACAAVARRMAMFSYHVTRTGEPFEERLYSFFDPPKYVERGLTLSEMGRYSKVLETFNTTTELAAAYEDGRLAATKGAGEKCLEQVKLILERARKPAKLPALRPSER